MNHYKFDVVIIGGGPAGSTSAMLLSRKGYSVSLIEKRTFPREVLCGEFISNEVVDFLAGQSLYSNFLSLHPNPVSAFRFVGYGGREISSPFGFQAYALKRSKLDSLLLSKSVDNGTVLFQPAELKEIISIAGGYVLKVKPTDGEEIEILSGIILVAYGKQNYLDKKLSRNFYGYKSKLNAVKLHIGTKYFNDFNSQEIQLYTGRGIYCGLNAVDEDTITLCFLEDRSISNTSPGQSLQNLCSQNKKFRSLFDRDFFNTPFNFITYGTGNIYFGKKEITNGGIFFIGDAAGVIAPLAGDGIGMAVQSAGLISEILCKNNLDIIKSAAAYRKEWKKLFQRRIYTAGIIQKIILNHSFQSTGINLLSLFPAVLQRLIKYTRC
jgi:flavin-dependent dehydrogenase